MNNPDDDDTGEFEGNHIDNMAVTRKQSGIRMHRQGNNRGVKILELSNMKENRRISPAKDGNQYNVGGRAGPTVVQAASIPPP